MIARETYFRVDVWDEKGETIAEEVARTFNLDAAYSIYEQAVRHRPRARVTLRQDGRIIGDSYG
jgi:hypothetical protein